MFCYFYNMKWLDIEEYLGLYQVSDTGEVRNVKTNRVLKAKEDKDGYLQVGLIKDRKQKWFYVHRLVAEAFLPNPDNRPEVNHKNENKQDNQVENIEWIWHKDNCNHGTRNHRIGEKQINGKKAKSVLQYSLDGTFIRKWSSMSEVTRQLGYKQGGISACCLGKTKQSYGFIWKYK